MMLFLALSVFVPANAFDHGEAAAPMRDGETLRQEGYGGRRLSEMISQLIAYVNADRANRLHELNLRDHFGFCPLDSATFHGLEQQTRDLIKAGAQVNIQDDEGVTPLMLAASHGHLAVVKILLKEKANPAITDIFGRSAFFYAKEEERLECAALLENYSTGEASTYSQATPRKRE